MKILAVSDQVLDQIYTANVKEKYPDLDLVIGCGDLPFYYLEFLVSALDVPLLYVLGNHDTSPQHTIDGRVLTDVQGGMNLHGRTTHIKNILFAGLEGSMRYHPGRKLMYSESEMRLEIARLIPRLMLNKVKYGRYLDVLITHSPPFGIHDRPDRPHTGFKSFLPFMRRFQPRYLLHGHIHIYRTNTVRVTEYEQTHIINVYPSRLIDFTHPPTL